MGTPGIEWFPPTRRALLDELKRRPRITIADLAGVLTISVEGVRQQLLQLQNEGWVETVTEREPPESRAAGRPAARYQLTVAGDHLYPKRYDDLSVEVIDTIAAELGPEALRAVLTRIVESRIAAWEPMLRALPIEQRLEKLKDIYAENDPHMHVEKVDGGYRLVENNCPFLNIAMQRPALCSVTLNTLSRLLGIRVVREERFQDGDGRCVFRILAADAMAPADTAFRFEDETVS